MCSDKVTKRGALIMFTEIQTEVEQRCGVGNDVAIESAWVGYVNSLFDDGLISQWQKHNWLSTYTILDSEVTFNIHITGVK